MRLVLTALVLVPGCFCASFEDVTRSSGIAFVLRNGATGDKHQIETMAGGVAMFDYDGDGKPDLYFANGAAQPGLKKTGPEWHNRLYRNRGDFKFEDVTAKAGVEGSGFHFGVAAADFDGDGRVDLFVTGMPRSHLYRNKGDGSFEDVTERAGVMNRQQWPVAAGWFDFDGDGDLDLFVVNYVRWDPAAEPWCGDAAKRLRTYCHPKDYAPLPNTLFRNNGDGTFTDVSKESGILAHPGKGMAVAFADYDSDGDLDVFVGNDTTPGFLFR
ncbi:MAG: VCBS repeat-containing protein, partial [Bryobacteraceae bacterium]|nr:VCBS repeat-containing protein [Bryobacteraceae bacterium]